MTKIKEFIKNKRAYCLLALIIIVQLAITTYTFVFEKECVHSDEIWSYGLANSYYQPFIYMRDGVFIEDQQPEDDINIRQWTTGETFNDYITVQPGEQFRYDSVYHNQTLDHHPPLYYFLLHTVCSFFPNTFSYWFAFFLSCIFLVFTQIFLFKLIRSMTDSENIALCGCLLYGAGMGALSTFIFLRQYSLLTMLTVMYTYFCQKLYRSDFDLKKNLPPVLITAFAAFMTHYYAIAYIGIFTACICIYLICRKKFKKMFVFGLSTSAVLGLFLFLYPAALDHFGYSLFENKILPFYAQTLKLASFVTRYNIGIKISMYSHPTKNIIFAIVFSLIVLSLPLCFLFRNEKWFIDLKTRVKAFIKTIPSRLAAFFRKANFIWLFILIDIIATVIFISHLTDVQKMGDYTMRYLFHIFPLICAVSIVLLYRLLSHIPKIKKYTSVISLIIVILAAVRVDIDAPNEFLNPYGGEYKNNDLFYNSNCVAIIPDELSVWTLTNFSQYFRNTNNVYVTFTDTIENDMEEIKSKNIDYVFITANCLDLTDEENEMVNTWNGFNEDEEINIEMEGEFEDNHAKICNEYITEMNNGEYYDILFAININGGYIYVLKLK